MDTGEAPGGYYTVNLNVDGTKIPYIVFANSEYHAARRVREATGRLALESDIQGPFGPKPEPPPPEFPW